MSPLEHDHQPVQHRDGKPPWCGTCGLTTDGEVPRSRFEDRRPPRSSGGVTASPAEHAAVGRVEIDGVEYIGVLPTRQSVTPTPETRSPEGHAHG